MTSNARDLLEHDVVEVDRPPGRLGSAGVAAGEHEEVVGQPLQSVDLFEQAGQTSALVSRRRRRRLRARRACGRAVCAARGRRRRRSAAAAGSTSRAGRASRSSSRPGGRSRPGRAAAAPGGRARAGRSPATSVLIRSTGRSVRPTSIQTRAARIAVTAGTMNGKRDEQRLHGVVDVVERGGDVDDELPPVRFEPPRHDAVGDVPTARCGDRRDDDGSIVGSGGDRALGRSSPGVAATTAPSTVTIWATASSSVDGSRTGSWPACTTRSRGPRRRRASPRADR